MRNIAVLFVAYLLIQAVIPSGKDAVYYFNQAEAFREKDDNSNAYKYYSKAISLDTTYRNAYFKRALLKMDMDSVESSIKDFSKAIVLQPSGDCYYYMANAKRAINDIDGACADYNTACDLQYNHACDVRHKHCRLQKQ